jgi:hypothetical protein
LPEYLARARSTTTEAREDAVAAATIFCKSTVASFRNKLKTVQFFALTET